MLVQSILLIIAGYLVGSIPSAYLVAKWRKGIDIRQHGSGNVGAANTLAVVGKRWSLFVTIFDIGKGALMVWFAQLVGLDLAVQAAIGLTTIAGHNWPVFLHFQGGRGVFTTFGVMTMLSPWMGVVALICPYLFFAPFKQIALGVILTMCALPVIAALANKPLGIEEPVTVSLAMLALMLLMALRRLTVLRSPISKDVPLYELIAYRLLFDRDIKDRETWLNQKRG